MTDPSALFWKCRGCFRVFAVVSKCPYMRPLLLADGEWNEMVGTVGLKNFVFCGGMVGRVLVVG